MKRFLPSIVAIAVVQFVLVSVVQSQQRGPVTPIAQSYVISANAGGVAHLEGEVRRISQDGVATELRKNEMLPAGQFIETGNGRAELLLNPGSFLRVATNSKMRFSSTSLDDISVELGAGSFIFELLADDDFSVLTKLGNSVVRLTRSGVFRVDVRPDGSSSLAVVKGRAVIGYGFSELRSGRVALFAGEDVRVEKFNRNAKDQFDNWSQARAKDSAKNNSKLQARVLRDSLLSSFDMGAWNYHRTLGVWVYDNRRGNWSFLPFGMGWSSPYGYGLSFDLWFLNLPYYIYSPIPQIPSRQGGTTPNPSPGNQPRTGGDSEGDRSPSPSTPPTKDIPSRNGPEIPAFRRFETNQRMSGNDSTTPSVRMNRDNGGWIPTDRRSPAPSVDAPMWNPGAGQSQGSGPVIQGEPRMDRQPSGNRGGAGESAPIIRDN